MNVAIIQARMDSTRLPGKVLFRAAGKTFLAHLLERLRQAQRLDRIVIATTTNSSDDAIIAEAEREGVNVFRGSEHDVLDRYYQAALHTGIGHDDAIVRVTADCPAIDAGVVDAVIASFYENDLDHCGNGIPPTYPDGLDVEIFRFSALERAWKEAKLLSEREHVSPYIWNNPTLFHSGNVANDEDLSAVRLTLDYAEDYELLKTLFESLYGTMPNFSLREIMAFLRARPDLLELNARYSRNEGYAKSLREEAKLNQY